MKIKPTFKEEIFVVC